MLCRSGWCEIGYVYRHEVSKDIYEVTKGNMTVECTEDHSLFDDKQQKIKPREITDTTKFEYYDNMPWHSEMEVNFTETIVVEFAKQLAKGIIDRVPYPILNGSEEMKMARTDQSLELSDYGEEERDNSFTQC